MDRKVIMLADKRSVYWQWNELFFMLPLFWNPKKMFETYLWKRSIFFLGWFFPSYYHHSIFIYYKYLNPFYLFLIFHTSVVPSYISFLLPFFLSSVVIPSPFHIFHLIYHLSLSFAASFSILTTKTWLKPTTLSSPFVIIALRMNNRRSAC